MNWKYERGRIYSTDEAGNLMTEAIFKEKGNGEIEIEHIFVDSSLRGSGMGGKMMETVADYLRKEKKRTTATCSYAKSWLQKNKEAYSDIISKDEDDVIACNINGKD